MRQIMIGLAVAALVALSARTEAHVPAACMNLTPSEIVPLHPNEVGTASWYGIESAGRTASGELYNLVGFTAAHRTLPLNTRIRVTNLRNGRTVILRVNDRGPHIRGRLLDVSKAAAERLGFIHAGKARVLVTVLRYPEGVIVRPESCSRFAPCASFTE